MHLSGFVFSKAHQASYSVSTRGIKQLVMEEGGGLKPSPAFNTEVKDVWSFISKPPYALMVCIGTSLCFLLVYTLVWRIL